MSVRAVAAVVVAAVAASGAVVGWGTTSTGPATGADGSAPAAGDPLDGATLFRVKGCASCHAGPETTTEIGVGPSLADAASWAGERRPGMSAEDYLAESVRTPGAFISPAFQNVGGPTTGMPELIVTDAELDALVGYLLGAGPH